MKRNIVIALLMAASVSGCAAAQSAEEPVNAEDVMFLQMMIPHHRQGVEIVRLARERGQNAEVRSLAATIESTQRDEIEKMTGWLHAWQQPLTPAADAHAGHDVPETDLRQITSLRKSEAFDRDLLQLLIAHQDDAVQLALKEGYGGANPQVKTWAKQMEQSRIQQITTMRTLVDGLP